MSSEFYCSRKSCLMEAASSRHEMGVGQGDLLCKGTTPQRGRGNTQAGPVARQAEKENSKSETRSTKQYPNSNDPNTDMAVLNFRDLCFEFVSNLEIRYSDFSWHEAARHALCAPVPKRFGGTPPCLLYWPGSSPCRAGTVHQKGSCPGKD